MINTIFKRRAAAQAREWFLKINQDDFSSDEFFEFTQWMEKQENTKAYHQLEQTWSSLGELCASTQGRLLTRHAEGYTEDYAPHSQWFHTLFNNYIAQGMLAFSAVVIAALFVFMPQKDNAIQYLTKSGEIREVTLNDGSKIILTPETDIHVSLNDQSRNVILDKGHAFFTVAKDANRPFTVTHEHYSVLVTGTVFGINTKRSDFEVAVDEGHVKVKAQIEGDNYQHSLVKGDLIKAVDGKFSAISQDNESQLNTWKQGILVYRDTPLKTILNEINGYTVKKVYSASQNLDNTKISLSINIDQLEELPNILEALLPVKAISSEYGKVMLLERN